MKALVLSEMLGLLALVVMAMVALVAGPAEGLVLSKCKLKTELEAALNKMEGGSGSMKEPQRGAFSLQELVAKMSEPGFNSTVVTVFDPTGPEDEMETADKPGRLRPVTRPPSSSTLRPLQRRQRAAMGDSTTAGRPQGRRGVVVVIVGDDWVIVIVIWMRQARPLATPSFDICQMPCNALYDGIMDDKTCLTKFNRDQEKRRFDPALTMRSTSRSLSQNCTVATPDYFDECL